MLVRGRSQSNVKPVFFLKNVQHVHFIMCATPRPSFQLVTPHLSSISVTPYRFFEYLTLPLFSRPKWRMENSIFALVELLDCLVCLCDCGSCCDACNTCTSCDGCPSCDCCVICCCCCTSDSPSTRRSDPQPATQQLKPVTEQDKSRAADHDLGGGGPVTVSSKTSLPSLIGYCKQALGSTAWTNMLWMLVV